MRTLTISAVIFLALANFSIAGTEQSMARCKMEYLKNEDALRWKRAEFYETCMKAEGFTFKREAYLVCDAQNYDKITCYRGPPEPKTFSGMASDWLNQAKTWLDSQTK